MSATVRGSAALSFAFVVAALGVLSASAQLNPTVKVLPKPQTSVPPECEQGLAPAVPRVIVAEAAQELKPARAVPPPSLDLKTQLRAVQLTAERGDRDAFKGALADARAAVSSYPPGGERNAANDVISVDSDLERLWDYEFTSPTGAFFDSSTDFVSMMKRYPEYSKAIADQTLTVNGQTLYPTVETRRFLISEASRRLGNLGVRTPTRIVEQPSPAPKPQPQVAPPSAPVPRAVPEKPAVRKAERTTPRTKPAPHKAARKPVSKKPKPPVKIAEARKPTPRVTQPAPVPQPSPKPAPQPTPTPVAPAPMPKKMPAPVPSVAPPPLAAQPTTSAAEGRGATTTTEPIAVALPTDTMTSTSKAAPTETTATTATTDTTAPAQAPAPSGGRMNLLFAIILIIVGIGVLIVLFRASD